MCKNDNLFLLRLKNFCEGRKRDEQAIKIEELERLLLLKVKLFSESLEEEGQAIKIEKLERLSHKLDIEIFNNGKSVANYERVFLLIRVTLIIAILGALLFTPEIANLTIN